MGEFPSNFEWQIPDLKHRMLGFDYVDNWELQFRQEFRSWYASLITAVSNSFGIDLLYWRRIRLCILLMSLLECADVNLYCWWNIGTTWGEWSIFPFHMGWCCGWCSISIMCYFCLIIFETSWKSWVANSNDGASLICVWSWFQVSILRALITALDCNWLLIFFWHPALKSPLML